MRKHDTILRLLLPALFLLGAVALAVRSPVQAQSDPDLAVTITHNGSDPNFVAGQSGTVSVSISNTASTNTPVTGTIAVDITLGTGLTLAGTVPFTQGIFVCNSADPDPLNITHITCSNGGIGQIEANASVVISFVVNVANAPSATGTNTAQITASGNEPDPVNPDNNDTALAYTINPPTATPTNTPTSTPTATNTPLPGPDLSIAISHAGAPAGSINFEPNSTSGSITVTLTNVGGRPINGFVSVFVFLNGGLTFIPNTLTSTPAGIFTGTCGGTNSVNCTNMSVTFAPGQSETIRFNVQAPATDPSPNVTYIMTALFVYIPVDPINDADVNSGNNSAQDPVAFDIAGPPTATPTPSLTLVPTLGIPTPTVPPSPLPPTATFTPTLIPPPPTRTPLPRPANAGQAVPIPPSGVNVVVNRDGVNVRLLPAIGAELVGFVNAGTTFNNVEARSPDNEWVRVNLAGQQAWIGTAVITVLNGDIAALPVADPRTIPYGGFENPRAGLTSLTGTYTGRLEQSGLRLRAGPSQGYPVLANAPRYAELRLLGRTADNVWLQVNWEGTLGWVAAQFVALPEPGLALFDTLPVDGIVADALPISEPTQDSYTDTLRLMRDRLELAQPSLDEIRARWTTIALGEQTQCGNYPARPSDYNIPNTVLAPFYGTLNPLMTDFNLAMSYLRQAIDLLIQSCQFAQPPEGLVGEGGAAVALQAVNDADALFSSLRARLNELIPSDEIPSEEQCLFTYQNQSEIVPRLRPGVVQFARLNDRNFVRGFCFDATVGASYRIEMVRASGNIQPQASISSFNNPTNFLGVGRIGQGETYTAIAPILIPETSQYIMIVSDLTDTGRNGPLEGEFAILLTDLTGTSGVLAPGIAFDPNTGQVIVNPSPLNPIVPTVPVSTPGGPAPVVPSTCPNITYTCAQLLTCGEAQACLAAGNLSLDADGDGIACEENLCLQTGPTLTYTPRPTVGAKRN